jgi:hypothetical protein
MNFMDLKQHCHCTLTLFLSLQSEDVFYYNTWTNETSWTMPGAFRYFAHRFSHYNVTSSGHHDNHSISRLDQDSLLTDDDW